MQYILTFFEGILAFVSPCTLPMLPVFLGYMSASDDHSVKKRFINTLFFVLGFSTIYVILGATAFSFFNILNQYRSFLTRIAGVGMVFFGFVYLDIFPISLPGLKGQKKGSGFFSSYIFGMSYAFGCSPCLGAFLGSALMLAGVQETVFEGMALLWFFSLGLGVPFLLFSVLYEKLYKTTSFLKKHSEKIKAVGATILIVVGVALAFDVFGYYLRLWG